MFNSKIKLVKLIRSACDLGLKECCDVLELWGNAFGYGKMGVWEITDETHIYNLLTVCKMISKEEWIFNKNGKLVIIEKPVTSLDIFKLTN